MTHLKIYHEFVAEVRFASSRQADLEDRTSIQKKKTSGGKKGAVQGGWRTIASTILASE